MLARSYPSKPPKLQAAHSVAVERNFGLSEPAFKEMHEALKEGDQRLFEQVFLCHFKDCVAYLCRKDQAEAQEAYDAVMEALLRFRDLLAAGKLTYGNLRYLFTRMARQELQRNRKRQGIFTSIPVTALDLPEEDIELCPEDFALLSRAFQSLGKDCRQLLRGFYYGRRSLKEIAAEEGRTDAAVRKQKSRCVATLRRYFHQIS